MTIAASTVISCFVSLTLSPALCAVLFKTHDEHDLSRAGLARRLLHGAFDRFNRGFERLSYGYGNLTRRLVRGTAIVLVVYVGLIGVAGRGVLARADRLHPRAGPGLSHQPRPASGRCDLGPDGSRSSEAATDIILGTQGHRACGAVRRPRCDDLHGGVELQQRSSPGLPSLYNHELPGVTANTVFADLRKRLSVIKDAAF